MKNYPIVLNGVTPSQDCWVGVCNGECLFFFHSESFNPKHYYYTTKINKI